MKEKEKKAVEKHNHSPATQEIIYDEHITDFLVKIEKLKQEMGYPKICSIVDTLRLMEKAGLKIDWNPSDRKVPIVKNTRKIKINPPVSEDESLAIDYSE